MCVWGGGGGYPKGDSISLLSDSVLGCSVEGSRSMLGGQCSHVLSSKDTWTRDLCQPYTRPLGSFSVV